MKKRIISLVLVVVMAVLALASCGYSYQSDDLTKYATFNKQAFLDALVDAENVIEIADGSFGTDEAVRQNKVQDKIFTSLGSAADADAKLYEGNLGKYDVVYYSYYVTATVKDADKNDVVRTFYANTKLAESAATKLQLGFSEYSTTLNEAVSSALLGKDIKDYVYKTDTKSAVAGGDVIYISYTVSQPQFNADGTPKLDAEGKQSYASTKLVYVPLTVDNAPEITDGTEVNRTFTQQLLGKKPGTVSTSITAKEEFHGELYDVTYSSINIHWIVESMTAIEVKDTTYTTTTKVTASEDNKSYDLKDVELTYHVLPVYYLDVEATVDAYSVIKELLGALTVGEDTDGDGEISKDEYGTFSFLHEDLKNGEVKIADIVKNLNEYLEKYAENVKAVSTAKKELDSKQKVVDDAGANASDPQKTALADAKKAYDEAVETLNESEEVVDGEIDKLLGCAEGLDEKVVTEYTQSVYDSLEDAYEKELAKSLSTKVWALALKNITYVTEDGKPVLPWDSVHAFYDRTIEVYKYEFYTGTYSSSSGVSNYDQYKGDFNAFLKVKVGLAATVDMQQVYDKIGAEAEENARQLIAVYSMYKAFGEDVALTDEDMAAAENMLSIYNMIYGGEYATLDDFVHAEVLNNVMDYLLEIEEREEGETDLTVVFKRVKYAIKSEDEDSKN